tara:strand:+ start:304 stop:444 length:141 start_codon:yes stop_codon:yes gene_type:complete
MIAMITPTIIFANPFILGTYKPKKKFTNGKPAHANSPIKTLYIDCA